MSTGFFSARSAIRRQSIATRKAAAMLAAATPNQRPQAERYAGRVASRLMGLRDGLADARDAEGERSLPPRIEAASRRLPGFDSAAYSDGWRTTYYA